MNSMKQLPWLLALMSALLLNLYGPGLLNGQDGGTTADQAVAPTGLFGIIFSGGVVGAIMIVVLLALSLTAA